MSVYSKILVLMQPLNMKHTINYSVNSVVEYRKHETYNKLQRSIVVRSRV